MSTHWKGPGNPNAGGICREHEKKNQNYGILSFSSQNLLLGHYCSLSDSLYPGASVNIGPYPHNPSPLHTMADDPPSQILLHPQPAPSHTPKCSVCSVVLVDLPQLGTVWHIGVCTSACTLPNLCCISVVHEDCTTSAVSLELRAQHLHHN